MRQDDAGFLSANGHSTGLVSNPFIPAILSALSIPGRSVRSILALLSSVDGRQGSGLLVRLAGARSP